jgi:hypothetical protein
MKKQTIFFSILIIAVGAMFFSMLGWMDFSGYAVKDVNDCLIAKNKFEISQKHFECTSEGEGDETTTICTREGETMTYEYSKSNFKIWTFEKKGEIDIYTYNLESRTCDTG